MIKGNQYIIINMESMKYNEVREFSNEGHKNEVCRGEIISKPGDAFENSYKCIVKLLNNHSIVISLMMSGMAGFKEIEIPFVMFFRALGVYSAKEIISYITYSFDDADPITKQMLNILERAMTNTYGEMNAVLRSDTVSKKGEPSTASVNVITDRYDTLKVLSRCIKYYDYYKSKMRSSGGEDTLNIERFLMSKVEYNLDQRFLPHIGLTEANRKKKAAYLGHMIHRILSVHLGVFPSTDRDSYKNK